jgi:hypothetical protein
MINLPLQSDAEQGTYTVSVEAYGIDKDTMIWSDTNTTTFDVLGKSIQEQLEGINATLGLMNVTLFDIHSELTGMNLTGLQGVIENLNQTLNPKLDSLKTQLSGVNDSLMGRISDAETNILSDLQGVNLSLSADIQNLLSSITNEVSGMNSSLSDQLTSLLNNMTTDNDALRIWFDLVRSAMEANLTATNNALQTQLNDLDAYIQGFNDSLKSDIGGILSELQSHDDITGQNHTDIKDKLDQLLSGGIGAEGIEELKTMLINLAGNLSEHNQSIANDIMNVVNEIEDFETQTSQKLDDVDNTLDDLAKLDSILTDLGALDQNLQDAQASINEIPTEKEEEEGFGIAEGLLIVVIVLLIINLLLTLMGRKGRESGVEVIPEEEVEPEIEEETEVVLKEPVKEIDEVIEEFEEEPEEELEDE